MNIQRLLSVICVIVLLFSAVPIYAMDEEPEWYTVKYNSVFARDDGSYEFRSKEITPTGICVSATVMTPFTQSMKSHLDALCSIKGSGTQTLTEEEFDPTSSFSVTLTVYAEGVTAGYLAYYKVTNVSVSINGASGTTGSYVGSGVYILSQVSTASSDGLSYTTGCMVDQDYTKAKAANIRSWSYSTPSSWHYVQNNFNCTIGATVSVRARRGSNGTPWTTDVVALLYDF